MPEATLGEVFLRLRPQVDTAGFKRDADRQLGSVGASAGHKFGDEAAKATRKPLLSGIQSVATSAAAGLAVVGVGKFLAESVKAAAESQAVAKQTEAVIRSTGGAAKVTADQVGTLSERLSRKHAVDDEVVQSGANLLLTFTNVRNAVGKNNDIFNQATDITVDMTAAMNGGTVSQEGLKASSIQVGKALNDPIKGISALSRVGVTFTEQQKEQIKAMVAAGDTAGAQKIILAELRKEFAGSAAAAATPWQRLQIVLGNLQEEIGAKLLPVAAKLADWLLKSIDFVGQNSGAFKALGVVIGAFTGLILANIAATKAKIAWDTAWAAGTKIVAGAQWLLNAALTANPIGIVVVAIGALVAALVIAYKRSETFRNIVDGVFRWFRTFIPAALKAVEDTVQRWADNVRNFFSTRLKAVEDTVQRWANNIRNFFSTTLRTIENTVQGWATNIRNFFSGLWNAILDRTTSTWNTIRSFLTNIFNAVRTIVTSYFNAYRTVITASWNTIRTVTTFVWNTVWTFLTNILNALVSFFQARFTVLRNNLQVAWTAIRTLISVTWNAIRNFLTVIVNGIVSFFQTRWTNLQNNLGVTWTAIRTLVSAGINFVRDRITSVSNTIRDIWNRVWDGVRDKASGVWGSLRSGASGFVSAFGGVFDNIVGKIKAPINTVIGFINSFYDKVRNVAGRFGVSLPNFEIQRLNRGGKVPGSGPNRDSVPAMLTPGEYVLPRKMVKAIGVQNLDHARMQFLATGGEVRRAIGASLKRASDSGAIRFTDKSGEEFDQLLPLFAAGTTGTAREFTGYGPSGPRFTTHTIRGGGTWGFLLEHLRRSGVPFRVAQILQTTTPGYSGAHSRGAALDLIQPTGNASPKGVVPNASNAAAMLRIARAFWGISSRLSSLIYGGLPGIVDEGGVSSWSSPLGQANYKNHLNHIHVAMETDRLSNLLGGGGSPSLGDRVRGFFEGVHKATADPLGTVKGAAGAALGPALNAVKDWALSTIGGAGGGVIGQLIGGMSRKVIDAAVGWVTNQAAPPDFSDFGGGSFGGGTGTGGTVGNAANAWRVFAKAFGLPMGGRAPRSNPSDHPIGKAIDVMTSNRNLHRRIINLGETLPGAKYWISYRQIGHARNGFAPRYYGGPSPHTDHVHWSFYKNGGVIPNDGPIFAHAGEGVLNQQAMARVGVKGLDALNNGSVGGPTYITVQASTNADPHQIAREVAWQMLTSGR